MPIPFTSRVLGFLLSDPRILELGAAGLDLLFRWRPPPPAPGARRVILESPFAGDLDGNRRYLQRAIRDSLERGEAPFASHGLYPGALNDADRRERALGIRAGLAWGAAAEATVVYVDRGISPGMAIGIDDAVAGNRPVEYRRLDDV